jgi:hypothetical protein
VQPFTVQGEQDEAAGWAAKPVGTVQQPCQACRSHAGAALQRCKEGCRASVPVQRERHAARRHLAATLMSLPLMPISGAH